MLTSNDLRQMEYIRKEEVDLLLKRYGRRGHWAVAYSICISPRYIYSIYSGFFGGDRNLVYERQDITLTGNVGYLKPTDKDLCYMTKFLTRYTTKERMKNLTKELVGLNPFLEIDKILNIVKFYGCTFNFVNNTKNYMDIDISYQYAEYCIALASIDYCERYRNGNPSKYLEMVWKCIDGWNNSADN